MGKKIAVETQDLTKKYDGTTVVDHLNLHVAENEVFGVFGAIGHHSLIMPPGQFVKFFKTAIGNFLNVIEEIWALRRHTLHIRVLVRNSGMWTTR